jgi:integrase
MQFDVRAAKALRAGDHLIIPGAPGLRLEASTAGRSFIYRYKSLVDGRMRQVKIGEWPEMSALQAGTEWERLRAERDAGKDPARERRAARKATPATAEPTPAAAGTVGALIDSYVEWAAPRRAAKGAAELRRTMATMLTDEFRALSPAVVGRSTAYDLVMKFSAAPVQALSLRRELGAAWEWGHDAGRLPDTVPNWWRLILRGRLKSKGKKVQGEYKGVVKRVLSPLEVGTVLRMLPNLTKLNEDLLTLYLWTGCRGAEIVQMEGAEISEDAAGVLWWFLPKAKVKMRNHELATDVWVPLVGRAREIALRRKDMEGAGYLFPARSGDTPHVQQKVIGVTVWTHHTDCRSRPEVIRPRWGIARWAPHDLRRTVRTQLSRLGCPGDIAEAVLGHIDADEDVYDRFDYKPQRLEWLTKLTESWEAVARR